MKLYIFWPGDHNETCWLIHREVQGRIVVDPRYASLVCKRCGNFSHDGVFALGFESIAPVVKVKSDIFATDDGFLCVNECLRALIEQERFPGLAFKPAGETSWAVVNVTTRFETRPEVFQVIKGLCAECNRPLETMGAVRHRGQLVTKPEMETFFTTSSDRNGSGWSDRDLFLTEAIGRAFRHNKIKGGALHQLLGEEQDSELSRVWREGGAVSFPKDSRIIL